MFENCNQELLGKLKEDLPAAYLDKTVDKLISSLSDKFGIGKTTINTKYVKPLNLKPQPKQRPKSDNPIIRLSEVEIEKLVQIFEEGRSVLEIENQKLMGERTPKLTTIHNLLRKYSSKYKESNNKEERQTDVEQTKILYEQGKSVDDIAKLLNKSVSTIRHYLADADIDISQSFTYQEKLEIYHYYFNYIGKEATEATAEKFNSSPTAIRRVVKFLVDEHSYTPRDNSDSYREYTLNKNYFDTLDSSDKAYILGLIATDGNVHNNSLTIELQRSDKEVLEEISKKLGSNRPIENTTHYLKEYDLLVEGARLVVQSEYLVNALVKYGITERKSSSLNINFQLITKEFVCDFWRGAIDGDGWLIFNESSTLVIGLCGTMSFLEEFQKFIKLYTEKTPTITHNNKSEKNGIYYITIQNKRDSRIIGNLLYLKSSIYLERKKLKYLEFCI